MAPCARLVRTSVVVTAFALTSCQGRDQGRFPAGRWIDLSHDFSSETVYWPTAEPFAIDTVFAGPTEQGFYYSAYSFCAAEHGGTHIDAPIHFADGGRTVDEIPLTQLIARRMPMRSETAVKSVTYLDLRGCPSIPPRTGRYLRCGGHLRPTCMSRASKARSTGLMESAGPNSALRRIGRSTPSWDARHQRRVSRFLCN